MHSSHLGLVAASLMLSPLATTQAEGIGYTYADVGYVVTDLDGIDKDLDGFLLRGSLEIAENWFAYARYLDQSVTFGGADVDLQQFSVGGGYAWSFADNMDLYGKLGYTEAEVDVSGSGGSVDDDGYELGVGIRARPVEPFELEGSVNYIDLSDSGEDTTLGVAARWYFTDNLALGVESEFGDDAKSYGVAFRWAFAN